MEHSVTTYDGRALPASVQGDGAPLVLCDDDPEVFGSLAHVLVSRLRLVLWEPGTDDVDRAAADLDAVRRHFRLTRTALLGHGRGALVALRYALDQPDRVTALVFVAGAEVAWDNGLAAECRALAVPTLVVEGAARGGRSTWVEALADALPDVTRVVLPTAGPLPWLDSPGAFGWAVLAHLGGR
ncbi:alpha/beta fold hydrolase [Saccharothrix coeruleofusca]|uniref:AB hydrolase-1 domain-containing protein n=1 Tax=Saccharothrix coeruleofusca TaxID=33919 RepID=A0A918ANY6_9PSEU|nr:alpha/beta hydrolase [Saccharothrix coeruleofusca]GGP63211.1 hypothetical protein GCM10010185_39860 [Saccharothrix coeruleofusca]